MNNSCKELVNNVTADSETNLKIPEIVRKHLGEVGFSLIKRIRETPCHNISHSYTNGICETTDAADSPTTCYVLKKGGIFYVISIGETHVGFGKTKRFPLYHLPLVLGTIAQKDILEDRLDTNKVQPLAEPSRVALTEQLLEIFQRKIQPEVRQLYGLPA